MDEKLALVKELTAASSSVEEFGNLEKANAAGMFCTDGELYLQFSFCPLPDAGRCGQIGHVRMVSMHYRVQQDPFRGSVWL